MPMNKYLPLWFHALHPHLSPQLAQATCEFSKEWKSWKASDRVPGSTWHCSASGTAPDHTAAIQKLRAQHILEAGSAARGWCVPAYQEPEGSREASSAPACAAAVARGRQSHAGEAAGQREQACTSSRASAQPFQVLAESEETARGSEEQQSFRHLTRHPNVTRLSLK